MERKPERDLRHESRAARKTHGVPPPHARAVPHRLRRQPGLRSGSGASHDNRQTPPTTRGPSTRRDAWPPDASSPHRLGPGESRDPGFLRLQGTAPTQRPHHGTLTGGGSAAAPPQAARTRAARRLQLGTRAGEGSPSQRTRRKEDGSPKPSARAGGAPHRAHARGRPHGPDGPAKARRDSSPDSEGGGAGRGRRKSMRSAPTRGGPADPFPPHLPPTTGGQRRRAGTLAHGHRR